MKTTMKKAAFGVLAALALASFQADATDIRATNLQHSSIHPYFRSNCFAAPTPKNVWVNFGGINANSQFTWDQFELLLEPGCKKPVVEFTYTHVGMLPPLEDLPRSLYSRLRFAPDLGLVGFYVAPAQVLVSGRKGDDDDDD